MPILTFLPQREPSPSWTARCAERDRILASLLLLAVNMKLSILLPPAAVLIALSLPAAAWWECHEDPYNAKIDPCVNPNTGEITVCYAADDCELTGCVSFWIYAESNGVPELQRCDKVHGDNCAPWGCYAGGDTVIF